MRTYMKFTDHDGHLCAGPVPLQTSVATASQLQDNTVTGAKKEVQVGMPTTELQSS